MVFQTNEAEADLKVRQTRTSKYQESKIVIIF